MDENIRNFTILLACGPLFLVVFWGVYTAIFHEPQALRYWIIGPAVGAAFIAAGFLAARLEARRRD